MAAEYILVLASEKPATEVLASIAAPTPIDVETDRERCSVRLGHVTIRVSRIAESTVRWSEGVFGLSPSIAILFRLDSKEPDLAFREMLGLLRTVFDTYSGDGVVHADELAIAKRVAGTKVLSDAVPWDEDDLSALGPGWIVQPPTTDPAR